MFAQRQQKGEVRLIHSYTFAIRHFLVSVVYLSVGCNFCGNPYGLHLLTMTKIATSLFFFCFLVFSCGQNQVPHQKETTPHETLIYDTSKIAMLPIDTTNQWVFKGATPLQLRNQDLQTISQLLNDCISTHNTKQDTTKEFSEYIDLKKYKLQYIPFIDRKGDRKVYINSFCVSDWDDFNYWKQTLVFVEDGGSCFFHLTVNLTRNKYEEFQTNGYA